MLQPEDYEDLANRVRLSRVLLELRTRGIVKLISIA